jgi:hypothetical protein
MVSVAASVMVAILATVIIRTVTTTAVSVAAAVMVTILSTVSVATAVMVAVPRAVVLVVTAIPGGRGRGGRRGGAGVALKLEAEIPGAIWVVGAGERAVLGASRVGLRCGGARVVGGRREDGVDDGEERAHEVVGELGAVGLELGVEFGDGGRLAAELGDELGQHLVADADVRLQLRAHLGDER